MTHIPESELPPPLSNAGTSSTGGRWTNGLKSISTLLSEENGIIIHKEACDYLIGGIVRQLYTDRYLSDGDSTSDLASILPRERSSIDKRTHIVRILAHRYYFHYIQNQCDGNEWCDVKRNYFHYIQNQCDDDEWCDVKYEHTRKNKNNALELYRKDIAYCKTNKSNQKN
jgi:hypothetical protein